MTNGTGSTPPEKKRKRTQETSHPQSRAGDDTQAGDHVKSCPLANLAVMVAEETTGKPIAGASVSVSSLGSKVTAADGFTSWENINPGIYDVSARKDLYLPDPGKQFVVNVAPSTSERVAIKLARKLCKFEARLLSVTFESPVKVCRNKRPVLPPSSPHWELGGHLNDGAGSLRAAAYLINGGAGDTVTVEISVTESESCSGPAKLCGKINDQKGSGPPLEIEGDCPISISIHKVSAKIKKLPDKITKVEQLPDKIKWYRGDMTWGIEVPDCKSLQLESTRVEVFFILDTPVDYYQAKVGVWVEALRFLCEKVDVQDIKDPDHATAKITQYCFSPHGLKYDSAGGGGSSYGVSGSGGAFKLDDYINKIFVECNCYDQAGAIQSLGGALGIKLTWLYLQPFGYLKKTKLIGVVGPCNNPFYPITSSTALIDANDSRRTPFGNHAFCEFSSKIYDACAGPHKGTESRGQYVDASIDKTTDTTLYVRLGRRPGTATDIAEKSGVTEVK